MKRGGGTFRSVTKEDTRSASCCISIAVSLLLPPNIIMLIFFSQNKHFKLVLEALRDSVLVTAKASSPDRSPGPLQSKLLPCLPSPLLLSTGTLPEEVDRDDPRFLDDAGAPGSAIEPF